MKYHHAAQPVYDPYRESAKFSTTQTKAHCDPSQPAPKCTRCPECNGYILCPSIECGSCGRPYDIYKDAK